MKIPKTFKLLGQTYTVEMVDKLIHKEDSVGYISYRDNLISIQRDSSSTPRPRQQTEKTFLHEKVHAILDSMGKHILRQDEDFVNLFAGLLHQSIITQEGNVLGEDK